MEEKKKTKKPLIIIICLTIIILGLSGYIAYDKLLIKETNTTKEETKKETKKEIVKEEEETSLETTSEEQPATAVLGDGPIVGENGTVATRTCVGNYSGIAETSKGVNRTLSIDLKEDSTFVLSMDNQGVASGDYIIVENALLLKITPDVCGGTKCSGIYSALFIMSNDCSSIVGGYTGLVYSQNFTLKKQ